MRWRNRPLEREERLPFPILSDFFLRFIFVEIRITTPLIGDVVVPRYERKRERHKNEREREKKKEKEKNSETSENDLPPKSAVGSSNGLAWSAWSFSEVEVAPGVAAVVASAPPPPPPPPDAEFSFSMPVPWNTAHGFVTRKIILLSRESASPRTPSLRTLFIAKKNPTRGGGGDGTGFAPDIYDSVTTATRSMSRNFGTGVSGYAIFPAKPRRRRCGSLILEKNNTSFFFNRSTCVTENTKEVSFI